MFYSCLVCAYPKLKEPPRSPSGGGSYEICPACGYQYGVDDDDKGITPDQWRDSWRKGGAKWSSAGIKPPKGWKDHPETKALPVHPAKPPGRKTVVRKAGRTRNPPQS